MQASTSHNVMSLHGLLKGKFYLFIPVFECLFRIQQLGLWEKDSERVAIISSHFRLELGVMQL
jgi:hypothetical protein